MGPPTPSPELEESQTESDYTEDSSGPGGSSLSDTKSSDEEIRELGLGPAAAKERLKKKERKRGPGSPFNDFFSGLAASVQQIEQGKNSSEVFDDLESSLLTASTGSDADMSALSDLIQSILAARKEQKGKKRKMEESFEIK